MMQTLLNFLGCCCKFAFIVFFKLIKSNYKKENKYEKTSHLSYSLNISKGLFVLIFD